MDLAFDRASFADAAPWERPEPVSRARSITPAPLPPPSRYGAGRPRWGSFAIVAALHAAALFALVKLDVIDIAPAKKPPLVVTLLEPEAMTPPPPPPAEPRPVEPTKAEIVTPPAIVPVAAPAPPPVAVTPAPAPPALVVNAAPPAPAAAAPVAAPVTAPDGFAGSLKNPAPKYPVEARRKRQQGTVRLRVVITPEGRVKEISVARSSGVESLDKAALEAVAKWKFRPGTQAGVPVEAVGYLPIPFILKD